MALAPMAGVTDAAFRWICGRFGADVVYSEMANVTALKYQPRKTLEMLRSLPGQPPLVVQLFGSDPAEFGKAARLVSRKEEVRKLGVENYHSPAGIDINFGCPAPKILRAGAGAELFKDFAASYRVVEAVIANTHLPVSVKLRVRARERKAIDFLKYMKGLDIKTVMVHGRGLSQRFAGPVDREDIGKIKDMFRGTVLANGGVMSKEDASKMLKETGADGVGVARGAMGNPFIFEELKRGRNGPPTEEEIYKTALAHAEAVYRLKGKPGIKEMRKHLCWYVSGLAGAKDMRSRATQVESLRDVKEALAAIKEKKSVK